MRIPLLQGVCPRSRVGAACLVLLLAPGLISAQKGEVAVETVEYNGWKNNLRLKNADAEALITLDVGPRIISYRLKDGKNVLKEYTDQLGKSGEKEWMIRGGHRLWAAPEDPARTYALDNNEVKYKGPTVGAKTGTGVIITPEAETEAGIQKELEIRLSDKGTRLTVVHRLKNIGKKPIELAPWALTVMAPGGVEIIPLPDKKPHPGSAKNAKSPADFLPNQSIALWSYTDLKDPRFTLGTKYILVRQDAKRSATKIGMSLRAGWVGYLNNGTLFVKRFDYQAGKTYPDNGCNFETFTNEDMLEVESLGPLVKLEPGKTAEHTETWELFGNVKECKDEADVDKNVLPVVTGK